MSVKTAAQLAFLVSVSTLLAALADLADARPLWVVMTVISHIVLIAVGARILRDRSTT